MFGLMPSGDFRGRELWFGDGDWFVDRGGGEDGFGGFSARLSQRPGWRRGGERGRVVIALGEEDEVVEVAQECACSENPRNKFRGRSGLPDAAGRRSLHGRV